MPSNLYFCNTCEYTNSEKKIQLETLPDILILVIKRYSQTGTKINLPVEYEQTLKIMEKGVVLTFNLTSIVHHIGDLYTGHYTSSIKINNKWYFIDDNSINLYELKCDPHAYILIYNKEKV